jgi:hypothetical protein
MFKLFGWTSKLQIYAVAAATFFISVFSIYMMGIARGGSKLKEKIAVKRQQDFRKSVEIEREISDLNDTSLADRASEWVRDDKSK